MDDLEIIRKIGQCEDKEQMVRVIQEYNENQRTKTNADRIRAMSDEELADSFTNKCLCDFIPYHTQDHCASYDSCKGCILEWLKQPAEGKSDER